MKRAAGTDQPKEASSEASLAADFERDGYLLIKGFSSTSECAEMRAAMAALIEAWDPPTTQSVFHTDKEQINSQGKDDYFMTSADKVRFFLEPGAADSEGGLAPGIAKEGALNKVGHALHVLDPTFANYCQSAKVRQLVRQLGWRHPSLVQSMYIFKQPRIGAKVTPHQDSCFLRTDPLSCLGLWLALQPATETNGCLWARPGSHREPLRRHFVRRGEPVRMEFVPAGPPTDPPPAAAAWEGELPAHVKSPAELGFAPLCAAEGDLVVIHGQLDHLSLPNTSDESRHTFQLHLVEGERAGAVWSKENWLQYPEGKPFPEFEDEPA